MNILSSLTRLILLLVKAAVGLLRSIAIIAFRLFTVMFKLIVLVIVHGSEEVHEEDSGYSQHGYDIDRGMVSRGYGLKPPRY